MPLLVLEEHIAPSWYLTIDDKRHDAELPETCCVDSCAQMSTHVEWVSWEEGVKKFCSDREFLSLISLYYEPVI